MSVCARVLAAALMAGAIAGALSFPAFVGDDAVAPPHALSAPPATKGKTLRISSIPPDSLERHGSGARKHGLNGRDHGAAAPALASASLTPSSGAALVLHRAA